MGAASTYRPRERELKILVLVRGKLLDGKPHYAYASIPESRYHAFKDAESAGNFNLRYFGEILAHGEGNEPPDEVKRRVEREYGVNHQFEDEFADWIARFAPALFIPANTNAS